MTNLELKQYIKDKAVEITKLKSTRKECEYGFVRGLEQAKYDFRHHHIASCLLRGRTIEQIEKPALNNIHNKYSVQQIMESIVFVKKNTDEIMEEIA